MLEETLEDAQSRMNSSVSVFEDDLDGFRTNQASTSLVSKMQVTVDMGGVSDTLLMNQLALIAVESARDHQDRGVLPRRCDGDSTCDSTI